MPSDEEAIIPPEMAVAFFIEGALARSRQRAARRVFSRDDASSWRGEPVGWFERRWAGLHPILRIGGCESLRTRVHRGKWRIFNGIVRRMVVKKSCISLLFNVGHFCLNVRVT